MNPQTMEPNGFLELFALALGWAVLILAVGYYALKAVDYTLWTVSVWMRDRIRNRVKRLDRV